jgi:hypothetical protein
MDSCKPDCRRGNTWRRRLPQSSLAWFRPRQTGGARVICFNAQDETIWLPIVYTKAKFDRLPTEFLVKLKQGVEDAL